MKTFKPLLMGLILVILFSCTKENPETESFLYLVKAKKIAEYSPDQTRSFITLAALENIDYLDFVDKARYDVNLYYVEYKTDYTLNSQVVASGLVAVPKTNGKPTMMVSFQSGTIVQHADAPSQHVASPYVLGLTAIASMGFTICISDNIGFGASSDKVHPYLNKALFQKSIVNLIRAVKELEENGTTPINLNGDLLFAGYSLGGWASLVAHKYVEDNGLEGFNLLGSVCGAGAYDLDKMREYLFTQTDYVQPFFLPFLVWGLRSTNDIEQDLTIYIREPYASRIPDLYDGMHSELEINAQLTSNIPELMTADLIEDPGLPQFDKLDRALKRNSQPAWANVKPIHLIHGTVDLHVPYSASSDLYQEFLDLNQHNTNLVTLTPMEGVSHSYGASPMLILLLNHLMQWVP